MHLGSVRNHLLLLTSSVYSCLLDFSKAFDKVNFCELFDKLRSRKCPPIVLRLLVFMYLNQSSFIRWNSVQSDSFMVKNGVRQGAILSPSLFCVYLDTLLQRLIDAGVGCSIGGLFLGAFGYADDVILLAPSRQALQIMLTICEDFASTHSMQFSTDPNPSKSKTKCMLFSRDTTADQVMNVKLNGDMLPWVDTAKHLGNHLSSRLNFSCFSPETKTDLLQKRAIFFDRVHQVHQQFGQYHPKLVLNLISIYSTALYGSNLWQICSEEHFKLNRSWNTAVKIVWDLPHPTHKRFLESICPVPHLESVLTGRYVSFVQSLVKSDKSLLRMILSSTSSDLSSLTGQNVSFLQQKHKLPNLKALFDGKNSLKSLRVHPLPNEELWKINLLTEISLIRKEHISVQFDDNSLEEILEFVCTA